MINNNIMYNQEASSSQLLEENSVYLWFVFLDQISSDKLLSTYANLLTSDEKQQQKRFYFEKHRLQYLITRALVRTVLSRYLGVAPVDLRFSKNEYGRPEILQSGKVSSVRFNLSHTDGLIALAVVLEADIGVDVEYVGKGITPGLADQFFSRQEIQDLLSLPSYEQNIKFFDYWTLKESYIKARGMGFSIPLDQFSFHLTGNKSLWVSFDTRLNDTTERWKFWLMKPTDLYRAALSVACGSKADVRLYINKLVPLQEETVFTCPIIY